jgi:hypothetical protein
MLLFSDDGQFVDQVIMPATLEEYDNDLKILREKGLLEIRAMYLENFNEAYCPKPETPTSLKAFSQSPR